MLTKIFYYGVLLVALAACATERYQPDLALPDPLRPPKPNQIYQAPEAETQEDTTPEIRFQETPAPRPIKTVIEQTDGSTVPVFNVQKPVSINVENLPLPAFINEVFGNLLNISFEIDPSLQKQEDLVTLRVTEPQPPKDLYYMARQVLENYGVGMEWQGEILRFAPSNKIQTKEPPLLVSGRTLPSVPVSHRPIFQFVPLEVVPSAQISRWLDMAYRSPKLTIGQDSFRNALILIGPADIVGQALEAVKFLDQPLMLGQHSLRIEPVFLSATALSQKLTDVLKTLGYFPGQSFSLMPIPEVNALIAFANSQDTITQIKQWSKTFDMPGHLKTEEESVFFYPVQHTKAENILEVLTPFLNSGKLVQSTPALPTEVGATTPVRVAQNRNAAQLVVDTLGNSLLYQGTAESWLKLLPVVQKLDRPAKQVLIEVTIAEITLDESEQFGIEWLIRGLDIGSLEGLLSTASLPVGNSGLTYNFNSNGQTRALLNAFASHTKVSVLSTPRLMVKNGESASINVGDEVPIVTSQSTDSALQQNGNTGILQQIQYRRTGVTLDVTPTVHAGNRVDLEIAQTVSRASENTTSGVDSPIISNRSINTKLALRDGGSVLLAGLIDNTLNKGNSGVPILKDMPFIGNFFRTESIGTSRRELLILIIPYVLDDDADMLAVTEAFKQRLTLQQEQAAESEAAAQAKQAAQ